MDYWEVDYTAHAVISNISPETYVTKRETFTIDVVE